MSKKIGYVEKTTINKNGESIVFQPPKLYSILPWIFYPFLLIFFIEALTRGDIIWAFSFIFIEPLYFLLNTIIVSLIGFFLWGIIGNKWISYTILNAAVFFLALVSHIKFAILGTGITLSDIEVFRKENLFGQVNFNIIISFILILIFALIVLYALIFLMHSFDIDWKKRVSSGVVIGLIFMVFIQLIIPKILISDEKVLSVETLGTVIYFNDYFYLENGFKSPTQEEVIKVFNSEVKSCNQEKKSDLQPNVIMVQVSNFWDLKFGMNNNIEDPLINYRKLLNEGQGYAVDVTNMEHSNLNGEYEALTGLSVEKYPYHGQIRGSFIKRPIMSLASIFRNNGYESHSIMGIKGTDNKRETFYRNLGFNSFTDLEDLTKKNNIPITDSLIIKEIGDTINKHSDKPQFIFTHLEGTKPSYTIGTYEEITNEYFEDLKKLDALIKEIFDMVGKTKKRTIIVFYSEKLPVLGKDNKLYEILRYVDVEDSLEKKIKMNKGSAFIWDNYTKGLEEKKQIEFIDLMLLPEALMTFGEFNMPNYFHYLNQIRTKENIEAFTSTYLIKDKQIFQKKSDIFNQFSKNFEILNNDILSSKYYIDKESKKWIIEDSSSYS